jgi:hypothetical protein
MNERLNSDDLHLLFDEPVFVLDRAKSGTLKEEANAASEQGLSFSYKGGFAKKIAVLVEQRAMEYVTEAEEAFLLKVIAAVDMGLEDIAIINLANTPGWASELQPDKIISFGTAQDTPLYEVQVNDEGPSFHADTLTDIMSDVALKRKLWQGLQIMFPK